MKVLMIDNYDSFVYNLVQYLGELGAEILVYRNDQISISDIEMIKPSCLMISPGPGIPEQAGRCCELIRYFAGKIPIFGVCLGHQAIGYAFGARVIRAGKIVHGKGSLIYHNGGALFKDIENPFPGGRYHSLIIESKSLPDVFMVSAWTEDGTIMAIEHKEFILTGVQFHPESVLTSIGKKILINFLQRSENENNKV